MARPFAASIAAALVIALALESSVAAVDSKGAAYLVGR
jgi:hypothetical protein